ncbi:DUF1343 domain-containing protein [Verrucomicrobia bacterium LW23]|nr:DUF1343 domain-containing protein [Verrucomicrobia bacterium LW23]PTY04358.1 DUF1343 domain-containing protein [Verrucomicrobia bacterium LW23]
MTPFLTPSVAVTFARRLFSGSAAAALILLAFAVLSPAAATSAQAARVTLGIDELQRTNFDILRGKRVGLVTNQTAINSRGTLTSEILRRAPGVTLVGLFAPEHGIDGKAKAGVSVPSFRDSRGMMVHSLYGDTRRPTPRMLKDIDVMVYDLQDIGCRSYTYISTLGYVMEECAKANIDVVLLDRPNPLGGNRMEGPRLDPKYKSFVGLYDIPYVYGLTCGELAMWINAKFLDKPCRLTVVRMRGYTREMEWNETGLRFVMASPNIPNADSAVGYAATAFLGEIGITNGANEVLPFEVVMGKSPKLDSASMAARFNALNLHGIKAVPFSYKSPGGKWKGSINNGIRLQVSPRATGNLTSVAFHAIDLLKIEDKGFKPFANPRADQVVMFDKLAGNSVTRDLIKSGAPAGDIVRRWQAGVDRWKSERRPYLLYQDGRDTMSNVFVASNGSNIQAIAETQARTAPDAYLNSPEAGPGQGVSNPAPGAPAAALPMPAAPAPTPAATSANAAEKKPAKKAAASDTSKSKSKGKKKTTSTGKKKSGDVAKN